VQQGASAAVALDAVAMSMSLAGFFHGRWHFTGAAGAKKARTGSGGNRAGLDPYAAGRSVYLVEAAAPVQQRSMLREVT
jgi:hypothetical protein